MRSLLILVLLSIAPGVALADSKPAPDPKQMVTDDCAKAVKAHKQCVIDMGGESIDGEAPKGDGMGVVAAAFDRLGKLMHPRRDFIEEIVRTAEDID